MTGTISAITDTITIWIAETPTTIGNTIVIWSVFHNFLQKMKEKQKEQVLSAFNSTTSTANPQS